MFRKSMVMAWMLLAAAHLAVAASATAAPGQSAEDEQAQVSDQVMARHVLSRMAFGPRPGEVQRVVDMGWREWMRRQLKPGDIDDSAIYDEMRARWPSLGMTMSQAFAYYRPPYQTDPPTMEQVRRRNELRNRIQNELVEAVIYRATFSERQFQEVIVEFWRNHFNVDRHKDDTAYLANHYEQQVIRRFAFGKFEHLLLATATHPAMLVYLDNIVSQKPLTDREKGLIERFENRDYVPRSVAALQRHRGLNENYARELMELHTLGVDNGYTQRDVTEVARALTGWSAGWSGENDFIRDELGIEPGGYGFVFREKLHDDGPKVILGTRFNGRGGAAEGVRILRGLAHDRRTAAFISRKLCEYLVSDEPSEELVQQVTAVFRKTRGDLPKVYEAIVFSEEFLSPQSMGTKFKTPFEFVISSLRATDARIDGYGGLRHALRMMGQPVYGCEDPTGYEDQAEAWLDPGVLVNRWMFALALPAGRISGVMVSEAYVAALDDVPNDQLAKRLMDELIPGERVGAHDDVLRSRIAGTDDVEQALGLVLGSPAFQQQ